MEHSWGLIFCTCFSILAAAMDVSVKGSKQHTIGWQQPSSNNTDVYIQWANSKRFHVGDSLSFEYRNDSVLVVDKWDYYHCNSITPIYSFDDGNTVINLDRPGFFYFISGVLDHCKDGEKLMIQVMGLHQIRALPPPPSPPPVTSNLLAPGPHPSSGIAVTATLSSFFLPLLIVTVASLE